MEAGDQQQGIREVIGKEHGTGPIREPSYCRELGHVPSVVPTISTQGPSNETFGGQAGKVGSSG